LNLHSVKFKLLSYSAYITIRHCAPIPEPPSAEQLPAKGSAFHWAPFAPPAQSEATPGFVPTHKHGISSSFTGPQTA